MPVQIDFAEWLAADATALPGARRITLAAAQQHLALAAAGLERTDDPIVQRRAHPAVRARHEAPPMWARWPRCLATCLT